MKLVPVIGLEIHIQLGTDMKMFCSCKNDPFFSEENTNVCPVCLGLPGAMPVPNKTAIESAIKMAMALGAQINERIVFERKNYFYPDLPKSFQLTCPHNPIATGGEFIYENSKGENGVIHWSEIHLEEDTAKSMHKGEDTLIDFNKSGVPLLEIVTRPDLENIDDAVNLCKEIQLIARHIGVSEADMEKGHMRLEANISMREEGSKDLPNYRVELKNINSFSFMKKAVQAEIKRQSELLLRGTELVQETRGYNEEKGVTFPQRSKEDAHDYRYFVEPDIPEIIIDPDWLARIENSMGPTLSELRKDLIKLGVTNKQYREKLVKDKNLYEKYLSVYKALSASTDMKANSIASLVIDSPEYKDMSAVEIIRSVENKMSNKISVNTDLAPIIQQVLQENPKAVQDYKLGNTNTLQFLVGQVMKKTKGNADPLITQKLLLTQINTEA